MPDTDTSETPDSRPHVISLCGTYLKPEMQSIYRQITGVQRVRTTVYAQWLENENLFPFDRIRLLTKQHHRAKGNFLLRFWYKHIVKQWPPPRAINKHVGPCHPWDLVERLQEDKPDLVHVYYGHKAVGYLPMLRDWGGPWIVSFHGVDVAKHLEEGDYLKKLRQVFAEARLVLARSESLLNRLQELGCPPEKLRLNRTPIPMDHLPAVEREAPANGHWRLIQACRLIAKKGIITTLEAMDRVGAIFPGARYILCGSGPMMEEIQAYVKEHALERHVEIDLLAQLLIVLMETMRQQRLAINESTANEYLRGCTGIDLAKVDVLSLYLKPMNQRALGDKHAPRLGAVVWLAVFVLAEVSAELGDPEWIDACDGAGEELRRLHDLTCDDPERLLGRLLAGFAFFLTSLIQV